MGKLSQQSVLVMHMAYAFAGGILMGFLLITIIETLLHHKLGNSFHAGEAPAHKQIEQGLTHAEVAASPESISGGWATVVGLSIHSIVEGVATGAGNDAGAVGFVVLAIICHKGFAAFAVGSANLSLWRAQKRMLWAGLVTWFALTGSVGILVGMAASADLEGQATAAVTAVAAGSLLSVGITEMLMPALSDPKCIGVKLALATTSTCAMSLLAVWA